MLKRQKHEHALQQRRQQIENNLVGLKDGEDFVEVEWQQAISHWIHILHFHLGYFGEVWGFKTTQAQ